MVGTVVAGHPFSAVPAALIIFGLLCALAAVPALAGVTFDLLHDTPATRRALKEELSMAAAPEEKSPVGEAHSSVDELENIWFAREKFLQIGETEKAQSQINLLWEKEMEKGIRNLPEYGEVLVREAQRDIGRGQIAKARGVLSMARKLSPDFLPVYFADASLTLKESFWDPLGAGQELVKGSKAISRSFRLQAWAAANVFLVAAGALCFYFAVSVTTMVLRNAGRIVHDISESLPFRFSSLLRRTMGWCIFLLPALIALPVWWWFIFAGVMLWPYVDRLQRVILLLAAAFLFSLPWQVRLGSSLLSMQRQPLLERIVAIREDHWSARDYMALKELGKKEGANPLTLSSIGLAAKRLGLFDEAEDTYRKALELAPDDPALWNNLGNIMLIRKETDKAIDLYEKAIGLTPDRFAPHYNLSLAYRDKFLFAEGERESSRAVAIDPVANAYYTGISGDHFNRLTVDEFPSLKRIWNLALKENKWQAATADHLWLSAMLLTPREIWLYVMGGVLLLGLGMWAYRSSRGTARACHKCGRAFCSRCKGSRSGSLCTQCHSLFVSKVGIEAKVMVKKRAEIKRGQQLRMLRRVLFAVLIPGGGHLVAGRFGSGTFFLLPATFFLTWFFFAKGAYPSVWHLQLSAGMGLTVTAVAALVLWWALSLGMAMRIEER